MHYTYVLLSAKDMRFYTGYTSNLRKRLRDHECGQVPSTCSRLPVKLVYYEACWDAEDARRRERFLKTGRGKRFIRKRISLFLQARRHNKLERH